MNVGEICTREVAVIGGGESAALAARLMREHHEGDLVVVEARPAGAVPVGIITDRDLVVEVVAAGVDPEQVTAADVMSSALLTVHEPDEVMETVERMRDAGVRRAPVVDDEGALVGILAVDDLIELTAEQLGDLARLTQRERSREVHRRP